MGVPVDPAHGSSTLGVALGSVLGERAKEGSKQKGYVGQVLAMNSNTGIVGQGHDPSH